MCTAVHERHSTVLSGLNIPHIRTALTFGPLNRIWPVSPTETGRLGTLRRLELSAKPPLCCTNRRGRSLESSPDRRHARPRACANAAASHARCRRAGRQEPRGVCSAIAAHRAATPHSPSAADRAPPTGTAHAPFPAASGLSSCHDPAPSRASAVLSTNGVRRRFSPAPAAHRAPLEAPALAGARPARAQAKGHQ